jgi:hypothetical protein
MLGFHSEMLKDGEFAIWEIPEAMIPDLIGAKMECNQCGRITVLRANVTLEAMIVRGAADASKD